MLLKNYFFGLTTFPPLVTISSVIVRAQMEFLILVTFWWMWFMLSDQKFTPLSPQGLPSYCAHRFDHRWPHNKLVVFISTLSVENGVYFWTNRKGVCWITPCSIRLFSWCHHNKTCKEKHLPFEYCKYDDFRVPPI